MGRVVPKDYYKSLGTVGFGSKPIGTGPYKFVEMIAGDRVVLEPNDDYWGIKPTASKITYQLVAEPAARVAGLISGEYDIVTTLTPDDLDLINGYSIPNFLLGLVFVFVFSVWLRVLPSSGSSTWNHAVLPIATFALFNAAAVARFMRSTLIDVLGQPYIAAARADGIPNWEVILRHALPNAAIPM
ncbi:ABC transporter substrate-binding protein [Agrobacterium vitis]|uniref:ABC transporter substrate-binding protein n=1 Tax=Agrobacterium vitis TaxID=373 RepID=UPI0023559298|nr:ABC transporter substrate-binding protein [Agrobacterium vitis]